MAKKKDEKKKSNKDYANAAPKYKPNTTPGTSTIKREPTQQEKAMREALQKSVAGTLPKESKVAGKGGIDPNKIPSGPVKDKKKETSEEKVEKAVKNISKAKDSEGGPPKVPNIIVAHDSKGNLNKDFQYDVVDPLKKAPTYTATGYEASLLDTEALKAKREGLDEINKRAMETGPSTWAGLQEQRQRMEELQNRENAAQDVMGAQANAQSQLAMRGGLGSGARERVAMGGQRGLMDSYQQNARQGQLARLGIGTEDQDRKDAWLRMSPQAELAYAGQNQDLAKYNAGATTAQNQYFADATNQGNQFNIQNTMHRDEYNQGNQIGQNQYVTDNAFRAGDFTNRGKLTRYSEEGKVYGSQQMADAIRDSGGGGGTGMPSFDSVLSLDFNKGMGKPIGGPGVGSWYGPLQTNWSVGGGGFGGGGGIGGSVKRKLGM